MADARPAPAFGRRREPPAPAPLETAALYARLTSALPGEAAPSGFDAWRKDRALGRRLAWAASLALMASGVAGVVIEAPPALSAALGAAGLFGGGWLRRERRRHLAAIRGWEADAPSQGPAS